MTVGDKHDSSTPVRVLDGTEIEVLFHPGEQFTGVTAEWLAPRLRLDPAASPVEGEIFLYLDEEDLHYDSRLENLGGQPLGPQENSGSVVSVECDDFYGKSAYIDGNWLVREEDDPTDTIYEYLAEGTDMVDFALGLLSDLLEDADPSMNEFSVIEVSSRFLDASQSEVVAEVLALAGQAGAVFLNGTQLR